MKNFESQQFRDELAKQIKEAPKKERKDILEKAKETPEYWQARTEKIKERQLEQLQQELGHIKEKAIAEVRLFYNEGGEFEYALAPNGERSMLNEKQWLETRTNNFKQWFGDWEYYSQLSHKENLTEEEKRDLNNLSETISKIIDENGEPAVVYHGTKWKFTEFYEEDQKKKYTGNYFTRQKRTAQNYTGLEFDKATGKPLYIGNVEQRLRLAKYWEEKAEKTIFWWLKPKYRKFAENNRRRAASVNPTLLSCYLKSVNPLIVDQIVEGRNPDGYGDFNTDVYNARKEGRDGVMWLNVRDGSSDIGTNVNVFRSRQIKSAEENNGLFTGDESNIYE